MLQRIFFFSTIAIFATCPVNAADWATTANGIRLTELALVDDYDACTWTGEKDSSQYATGYGITTWIKRKKVVAFSIGQRDSGQPVKEQFLLRPDEKGVTINQYVGERIVPYNVKRSDGYASTIWTGSNEFGAIRLAEKMFVKKDGTFESFLSSTSTSKSVFVPGTPLHTQGLWATQSRKLYVLTFTPVSESDYHADIHIYTRLEDSLVLTHWENNGKRKPHQRAPKLTLFR